MKKDEIHLGDWQRILFGQFPPEFYLEVLLRVAFIYLLLLVSMRLMGQRMSSQMSRNEMAAMVSLAAAIGVPILDAQRGLLPVAIIATVVVLGQRFIAGKAAVNEKFEMQTQGKEHELVEDGVLNWQNLEMINVSRDQVMAQLRGSGLIHLGEVKRLYMEANGAFTLVKEPQPIPGLPILPEWDKDFLAERTQKTTDMVCHHCGAHKTYAASQPEECVNCGRQEWVPGLVIRQRQPEPQPAQ